MSTLALWNQALGAAEARGRVASLTEVSPEQEVCEQWYSQTLDSVQSAAWWPSCKAVVRLALLAESSDTWASGDPEPGYNYAYALPSDFLYPWYLSDYSRFSLSTSGTRTVISTNVEDAILTYAKRNTDAAQWLPGLRSCVLYALAANISAPLTGKNSLVQRNIQLAERILDDERAKTANAIEPEAKSAVPWLAARGYSSVSAMRFYYPFGSLLSISDAS